MKLLILFTICLIYKSSNLLGSTKNNKKLSDTDMNNKIKQKIEKILKSLDRSEILFLLNPYKVIKLLWKLRDIKKVLIVLNKDDGMKPVPIHPSEHPSDDEPTFLELLFTTFFFSAIFPITNIIGLNFGFNKLQKAFKLNDTELKVTRHFFFIISLSNLLIISGPAILIELLKKYNLYTLYKFIKYWIGKTINKYLSKKDKKKFNEAKEKIIKMVKNHEKLDLNEIKKLI